MRHRFFRSAFGSILFGLLLSGCGGQSQQIPPSSPTVPQGPAGDMPAQEHHAAPGTIREFGGTLDGPGGITSGPGYALWFTQSGGTNDGKVSYISTDGTITDVAGGLASPYAILTGPDDALWVGQNGFHADGIAKVSTHGAVNQLAIPGPQHTIVRGPDGNFWYGNQFIGNLGGDIYETTPAGVVTYYNDPPPDNFGGQLSFPDGLSFDAAGNLWFTEEGTFADLARMTPAGMFTKYALPLNGDKLVTPQETAKGPGGVWFTVWGDSGKNGFIGKIAPDGTITEYAATLSQPEGITLGPDGAMWFTEEGVPNPSTGSPQGGKIGRITATGTITEYGKNLLDPQQIVLGSDGNLWFTEFGSSASLGQTPSNGRIGRIVP
jgi:virginiamycin B lyase